LPVAAVANSEQEYGGITDLGIALIALMKKLW
jgi:hypothetical protein